jgi:hypothetical protein
LNGRSFPREWRRSEEFEIRYQTYYAPVPLHSTTATSAGNGNAEAPTYNVLGTPKWFKGDPFEWLTLRDIAMHKDPWLMLLITLVFVGWTALAYPEGIVFSILFLLALIAFLCVAASRPVANARKAHVLELLITTPLGAQGVVDGHMRALRRVFLLPGVIVCVVSFFIVLWQARFNLWNYYVLGGLIGLFVATPWIGMWMGLLCRTPARAVVATLVLVGLLPRLGGCLMIDLIYFIVLGLMAYHQVTRNMSGILAGRDKQ